jgi:hypothetical protein
LSTLRSTYFFVSDLWSRSLRSLMPITVMTTAVPKNRRAEMAKRMIQTSAPSVIA